MIHYNVQYLVSFNPLEAHSCFCCHSDAIPREKQDAAGVPGRGASQGLGVFLSNNDTAERWGIV